MSYCRWGSDNWHCDLYCYNSGEAYITHIATNRIAGDVPKCPDSLIIEGKTEEWNIAYRKQREFLGKAEHKPIGLPYDGKSFDDPDLVSFLNRLLELRQVGYNFPDYVLERVREEIAKEI